MALFNIQPTSPLLKNKDLIKGLTKAQDLMQVYNLLAELGYRDRQIGVIESDIVTIISDYTIAVDFKTKHKDKRHYQKGRGLK